MSNANTIENPKIYGAIAGVIADCGFVGKDKVNKQQGFKYRSVDDVFNALHPALAKNKVVIVPTVVERTCEEVGRTKNGTALLKVVCKVKYDIFAEDGSRITSIIYGEGMDMGDKATNKAMAIAVFRQKRCQIRMQRVWKEKLKTRFQPTRSRMFRRMKLQRKTKLSQKKMLM